MPVHTNGYFQGLADIKQHIFDASLASAIVKFFKKEGETTTVVDLGCGDGSYVRHFRDNGIVIDGFDGNPVTGEFTKGMCGVLDLSIPHTFDVPYDWVMSLEVGEHLPPQFEDVFMNNLHTNNRKGIVLSWAVKGQGGKGHFNERNNDYIKSKIMGMGYINDIEAERSLRQSASLGWFKNTIMVFRK